jgi:hypothetical protein
MIALLCDIDNGIGVSASQFPREHDVGLLAVHGVLSLTQFSSPSKYSPLSVTVSHVTN